MFYPYESIDPYELEIKTRRLVEEQLERDFVLLTDFLWFHHGWKAVCYRNASVCSWCSELGNCGKRNPGLF